MKKQIQTFAAAAAIMLVGACQSQEADAVEDAAEDQAAAIDEAADAAPTEAREEMLEQKADIVEEEGEERANAMDDNGEIAPSETGIGDTQ